MKSYFAYIRVSTARQGEQGSSLIEQRSAIEAYARRYQLRISEWYEERETAAKEGRRTFNRMLAALERGRAAGLIIHKIDRSARNLRDWARVCELIDRGVEVHSTHESLDLASRGGRLSADIQAVVAADYIRNLREEVRKGFYGRLKQGFYPLPAPRGYVDQGKAKAKTVDPIEGPLVRQAFELYATTKYSLDELRLEMARRGLRSRNGNPLAMDAIASILHNPFYMGVIRLRRTGETFDGVHEPLISPGLFQRVQLVLKGRVFKGSTTHAYIYRRLIRCASCRRSLTGERQKSHIYYRCHGKTCERPCINEAMIEEVVSKVLSALTLEPADFDDLLALIDEQIEAHNKSQEADQHRTRLALGKLEERLGRLTDAYLDGVIDGAEHAERRATLLTEKRELEAIEGGVQDPFWVAVRKKFELSNMALPRYENSEPWEKREILISLGSNLIAHGKDLVLTLDFPFEQMKNALSESVGGPCPVHVRTRRGKHRKGQADCGCAICILTSQLTLERNGGLTGQIPD